MEAHSQFSAVKTHDRKIWRDKLALWIIGLQIRCGYVLLLVAAMDILIETFPKKEFSTKARYCHEVTTGIVLVLANVPALLSHWILPCLPRCPNIFVTISILLNIAGYFLLAFGMNRYVILASVALISMGYGIGDYKLIKIRSSYPHKTSRCYDSGVIHAEFIAAFCFTFLRYFKIKMTYIMLGFLSLPLLALGCFFFLLRPPQLRKSIKEINALTFFHLEPQSMSFDEKMRYIGYLMKYVMPMGIMTFLQGFVNQGLYEFIYFYKNFIDFELQYCFYIVCFNLGFYACLVTRNLLLTRHVSICVIFQLIITTCFLLDAIFGLVPFLWTICLLAYLQGIVHGVAYTSAMDKMLENEASEFLHVAKAIVKSTIFLSSTLSGAFDFGVHFILSKLPEPSRP